MPRFLRTLPLSTPHPLMPRSMSLLSTLLASRTASPMWTITAKVVSPYSTASLTEGELLSMRSTWSTQKATGTGIRAPLRDPAGDANVRYAIEESVEALRHENDAMRMQITTLSSQHALDMQDIDRKMCDMLARLDALTGF